MNFNNNEVKKGHFFKVVTSCKTIRENIDAKCRSSKSYFCLILIWLMALMKTTQMRNLSREPAESIQVTY